MSMHRDDGTNLIDFLQGSFLNNEVVDVGLLSFYELVYFSINTDLTKN